MKVKKINRYYCDFCKKSGCNKYFITRHEKHCTLNPERKCRFCQKAEQETRPMKELTAVLHKTKQQVDALGDQRTIDNDAEIWKKAINKLKELTGDCPACILSAIRQANCVSECNFDYKAEVNSFWADFRYDSYGDY